MYLARPMEDLGLDSILISLKFASLSLLCCSKERFLNIVSNGLVSHQEMPKKRTTATQLDVDGQHQHHTELPG